MPRQMPRQMPRHPARLFALLAAIPWLGLSAGCRFNFNVETVAGSGTIKTEQREASGFTAIQLDGVGRVVVTLADKESLAITTDDNLLPLIESSVSDGTLYLSIKDSANLQPTDAIEFAVEVKSLDQLTLNGAGHIRAAGVQSSRLDVEVNGVGDVRVAGSVQELRVRLAGTGGFQGDSLAAKNASVSLSGTGDIRVRATDTLDIELSGTGSVTHSGGAKVTQSNTGTGDIRKGD